MLKFQSKDLQKKTLHISIATLYLTEENTSCQCNYPVSYRRKHHVSVATLYLAEENTSCQCNYPVSYRRKHVANLYLIKLFCILLLVLLCRFNLYCHIKQQVLLVLLCRFNLYCHIKQQVLYLHS